MRILGNWTSMVDVDIVGPSISFAIQPFGKLASHMRTARFSEIRDDAPCVVRDEIRRRLKAPVTPTPAASTAPAGPQRPDVIDCRVFGDLKVPSTVRFAARQRCVDSPGYPIGTLPVQCGLLISHVDSPIYLRARICVA